MQEITAINVNLPPDLPEITTLFDEKRKIFQRDFIL